MDLFIFTTADGHDVAIPEDDIATIWSAKTPGHTLIERVSDTPDIEVEYEFNALITDFFDHVDLRPRARKPKKRPVPKAKYDPMANLVELEKCRGKK